MFEISIFIPYDKSSSFVLEFILYFFFGVIGHDKYVYIKLFQYQFKKINNLNNMKNISEIFE